ncbi:MAG: tRNA uridine-5-carboxymethylaminomethyl(34) synthesis enzyme MnmG [Paludibacteraceae bacterium]|nr:tRNA uridine-5-carboxymethylaminomethyl(34) synthesis enzyme MnmG [Paludibacteraceae bacterium]
MALASPLSIAMADFEYDIIVVGAGHAGCEAASAAARLGSKTLLVTMDMNTIGQMSCNPAVGGIAKGQIVREIDALGGQMGIVTDRSAIQFRMLNKSKGPAMWSPRSQSDRKQFIQQWIRTLTSTDNLHIWQDEVVRLLIDNQTVTGVVTRLGVQFKSRAVILTNGTFLSGLLHFGRTQIPGGRIAEKASVGLTEQLVAAGFVSHRMKTGTPARLDKRSIDFSVMQEQQGDVTDDKFSYLPSVRRELKQMSCFITYTNPTTHEILRRGLPDSPLYNGQIQSIGPRYCPSIETKIITFADKEQHQLFLEPEGVDSGEYYVNGFSSSMPWQIQLEALHSVRGLEHCVMYRPGYAIEYDFFDPTQLHQSLETKLIHNLFFAGQINGTTGYEEAAGQGIMAGINAHRAIHNETPLVLSRDESYIGVLIDDLTHKGVDEPYRMFTSRAEYRILLRQDNADERLTTLSYNIGLAETERYRLYQSKQDAKRRISDYLQSASCATPAFRALLEQQGYAASSAHGSLHDMLMRPNIVLRDIIAIDSTLQQIVDALPDRKEEIIESVEIDIKYSGYITRERLAADKLHRLDAIKIPADFRYNELQSLSTEARQKLTALQPATIGDASRIPGVSPNDISVLLVLMGR